MLGLALVRLVHGPMTVGADWRVPLKVRVTLAPPVAELMLIVGAAGGASLKLH